MNRRTLLEMGATGAFLGAAGCLDEIDPRTDQTTGNEVPGCTQKDAWETEITTGPTDPDPASIAGRRDCANADRPEPTGDVCETFEVEGDDGETTEFHSAGVEPYPDPPSNSDEEAVHSFVSEYERAYTQNGAVAEYGDSVVEFSYTTHDTETVDESNAITTVYIAFGFGFRQEGGADPGGYHDAFGEGAIYGIDETGIVRTDAEYYHEIENLPDDPEALPDPVEDGQLLQCF
ncbi:hypothetical protein OB905_04765 [Halobacteria archaeon AArc-dxtr1]|nr:hypothetical protein [Halobacteria archaeon AArc-dxtr1]